MNRGQSRKAIKAKRLNPNEMQRKAACDRGRRQQGRRKAADK